MSVRKIISGAATKTDIAVEDVFSTYTYTGNGTNEISDTQSIENGIDLLNEGGLVWIKSRNTTQTHFMVDSERGFNKTFPNGTAGYESEEDVYSGAINPTTQGFIVQGIVNASFANANADGDNLVAWTFRKAPKFFDIVTYTGTGSTHTIPHNLQSVPGCIVVKALDSSVYKWVMYHRSADSISPHEYYMYLNDSQAVAVHPTSWAAAPTASVFTVGTDAETNEDGQRYVAYIFGHDTSEDGMIQCGTFDLTSGLGSANLGWEPQWMLARPRDSVDDWAIFDYVRTWADFYTSIPVYDRDNTKLLSANLEDIDTRTVGIAPTPTGIKVFDNYEWGSITGPVIYIAIRKGPMRKPLKGTDVFQPIAYTGNNAASRLIETGFPVDSFILMDRTGNSNIVAGGYSWLWVDRQLSCSNTFRTSYSTGWDGGWGKTYFSINNNEGLIVEDDAYVNNSGTNYLLYAFRRAPGFYTVSTFTTTSTFPLVVPHDLEAVPEMVIVKRYDSAQSWWVYHHKSNTTPEQFYLTLNNNTINTSAAGTWITPSATNVSYDSLMLTSNAQYMSYMFASLPGVSKVGSYIGNSGSQIVDCGFTTGARFVMVKQVDEPNDWFVFDVSRGIVSGNDPYQLLNSDQSELSTDVIEPHPSGFIINHQLGLNTSTRKYIFLAIA